MLHRLGYRFRMLQNDSLSMDNRIEHNAVGRSLAVGGPGGTAGVIPVIDLFAGPGGLGEGFSALTIAGGRKFELRLSIEKDRAAHETLRLRAFFRKFPTGSAPDDYYRAVRGEIPIEELSRLHPEQWRSAEIEAWNEELGSRGLRAEKLHSRISAALESSPDWVLIGGPPCQAYSIAGRSRNKGNRDYKAETDTRHFLYREYLGIIAKHWPAVFVMENVKGILTSRIGGRSIFAQIIEDLQDPAKATGLPRGPGPEYDGYRIFSLVKPSPGFDLFGLPEHGPRDYIIECERYGIPQARHRVILLGIRNDIDVNPDVLSPSPHPVASGEVLGGLPRLRSGLTASSDGPASWKDAVREISKPKWMNMIRREDEEVARRIAKVVKQLRAPRHDRGGEFVSCEVECAYAPEWYLDPRIGGASNSTSRAHIDEDLYRYLYAACFAEVHQRSPKLGDLPPALLPEHGNVDRSLGHDNFTDRFRVQLRGAPATTVVSHIAKDGHYYIHYDPSQCRSLTVREAARLQTFPDNYYFCGVRTEQYEQVGNAVPPLLALQIAQIVHGVLGAARPVEHGRLAYA
jgi:DNA (cytosine-5)-methyltransferase 1